MLQSVPAAVDEDSSRPFILQKDLGPQRKSHGSALGFIGPAYGYFSFGVSGFFAWPVLERTGLWNDALYIEGGGLLEAISYTGGTALFLQLVGGARYDVHITEPFSVYVALRTGPAISFSGFRGFGWSLMSASGLHYRFSDALAFRLELFGGNYSTAGIAAGMSFLF